jgi:DNA-binding response OmpR family regulator
MGNSKTGQTQGLELNGARVLVIEDEFYIADDLRRTLKAAGAELVGPYSTVATASRAVDDGHFDCAVIDLNLHGESAIPIAERLFQDGKSFAIATGYALDALPEHLKHVPRVEKPFDPPALLEVIGQLSCARAA